MGFKHGGDIVMDDSDLPTVPEGGQPGADNVQSDSGEEAAPHPPSRSKNYYTEVYPGAAQTYGKGPTFMDGFDGDEHAAMREDNLYYPWASQPEWELASFLLRSSLSMAVIDQFLSLKLVSLALY